MAVLLRPFDCFALGLEGGKDVIGVILNNIIIDRVSLWSTPWTRLDKHIRHVALPSGISEGSSYYLNNKAAAPAARTTMIRTMNFSVRDNAGNDPEDSSKPRTLRYREPRSLICHPHKRPTDAWSMMNDVGVK
jgi:hypothetical protein